MEILKIIQNEADVEINLVANTWQTISLLDNVLINTDLSTFFYDSTGEITIKRESLIEISGCFYLINDLEETPDTHIALALQKDGELAATRIALMYRGVSYIKQLESFILGCNALDKLSLQIMSPETITIKTSGETNSLILKRLLL